MQETIEPGFEPGPILDEQLRVGDARDVLRRGSERLGRRADRHDIVNAHVLAADALHEGIERRDRGRDLDFSGGVLAGTLLRRAARAAGERDQKRERERDYLQSRHVPKNSIAWPSI